MSKEITAEEFKEKYINDNGLNYIDGHDLFPLMEQYAKAKVLEALEREVIDGRMSAPTDKVIRERWDYSTSDEAINYYETEVKPKYK